MLNTKYTKPQAHPQFTLQTGKLSAMPKLKIEHEIQLNSNRKPTNFRSKRSQVYISRLEYLICSVFNGIPLVTASKINSFHILQQERYKIRKRNCFQRLAFDGREKINFNFIWFVARQTFVDTYVKYLFDRIKFTV